jgi:predicted transcriptional regulator
MKTKTSTSIRLSPEGVRLLRELAEKLGVSQSAVMELAIREMATKGHNGN